MAPALQFFTSDSVQQRRPPSGTDLSLGFSLGGAVGASLASPFDPVAAGSDLFSRPSNDPFGLSSSLLLSQGTATATVAATADAPFTIFGFSRAQIYTYFDTTEEIYGNAAFLAGIATLVAPNPATAAFSVGAKVTQAALGIGKIIFSENPLSTTVEVGVSFFVGRASGAAAGQVFRAARRAGLIDSAVNFASRETAFVHFIYRAPRDRV